MSNIRRKWPILFHILITREFCIYLPRELYDYQITKSWTDMRCLQCISMVQSIGQSKFWKSFWWNIFIYFHHKTYWTIHLYLLGTTCGRYTLSTFILDYIRNYECRVTRREDSSVDAAQFAKYSQNIVRFFFSNLILLFLRRSTLVFMAHGFFAHSSIIQLLILLMIFLRYKIEPNKHNINKKFQIFKEILFFFKTFPLCGRGALPSRFHDVMIKWSFVRVRFKK